MSEELSPEEKTSNTSKYSSNFLYKTLIVTIFIVIIPLFPSQAPEFINQTVSTRSWELLHLLFVGIAVSYGLFSRRKNDETDNVSSSKFENAQSYVSRFLQVSSVFDDDAETPTGLSASASASFDDESNKVQTWSSQYFRGEPVVVVAQESSVFDEQKGGNGEKPLLLPVRSLKSRVSDVGVVEYSNDGGGGGGGGGGVSGSLSRSDSNSGSKRFSSSSRKTRVNGESRGVNPLELEENLDRNVVLPSPIPWRSRSGRMEMKEQVDGNGNGSVNGGSPLYTQPPAMEESEFFNRLESRSFKSQSSRSSKPNSLSSSQSSSFESQKKNVEDLARKKSFHKSSAPPPPPPPPPPMNRRAPLTKSYSSTISGHDWGQNGGGEDGGGMIRRSSSANESKSKAQIVDTSSSSLMGGKYVRTIRGGGESFGGNKKFKEEVVEDEIDHDDDKQKVVEKTTTSMEKTGKKSVKFDQTTFFDFQRRNSIKEFMDQVIVETDNDDDSETEADNDNDDDDDYRIDRNANNNNNKHEREEESTAVVSDGGGPDVDKKADEFIAKFREQIRLQRIASIKKSSGQINRNSSSLGKKTNF